MKVFSFNQISGFVSSQGKKLLKPIPLYCMALLLMLPNQPSIAQSTNANLDVTALVASRCIVKNGDLSFGVYDPLDANSQQALQSVGHFDVQCVKASSTTLQLNSGMHAANADGTSRAMSNANNTSFLSYEIYTSSNGTTVWSSANTITYSATDASPSTINVYGKIPANQLVENGSYSDVVQITANF